MPVVGRIKEIWRYPVKSMQGEQLQSCRLDELGIFGDRGWALRDEDAGEIRGAKKIPKLLHCRAAYVADPGVDEIPHVRVTLPDGSVIESAASSANEQLSDFLGMGVSFSARRPPEDREHYRRSVTADEAELRKLLGQAPDEPLADLSVYPRSLLAQISEFTSVPGTYFDAYPIHFISTSSLQTLSALRPESRFEVIRFRPNFVIDCADSGLPEFDWCGKPLKIGSAELNCEIPTIRCVMSAHGTSNLPTDIEVLSTIARKTDRKLGAYASVSGAGQIEVGDDVELT